MDGYGEHAVSVGAFLSSSPAHATATRRSRASGNVEPRARVVAGLGISSSIGITDGPENPPKADVTQARIELILDDVGDNIGALIATLNAAIAMRNAAYNIGLIYSLRRARAYWKFIAADAERLAALRKEGGQ